MERGPLSYASPLAYLFLLISLQMQWNNKNNPKGKGEESNSGRLTLSVEGVVYCLSCSFKGEDGAPMSLSGSHPLIDASVGVTCKDQYGFIDSYGSGETDGNGYFLIEVELSLNDGVVDLCRAYIVSSNEVTCKTLTNFNNGTTGAPLNLETSRQDNLTIYSVGPFAFAPTC